VKDVIRVLQNLAAEEGIIPDFYKALNSNIMSTGGANIISTSSLKKRKLRGLPPLPKTKLKDIERLAEVINSTRRTK
jgi:heterodisulfide reductase subunit C